MSTPRDSQSPPERGDPSDQPVLWAIASLVGGALWIVLAVAVYGGLPRVRGTLEDLDAEVSLLTEFVLNYTGLLLFPLAAAIAVALLASRSRQSRRIAFFGLPLALLAGLALTVGQALLKLLSDLS